MLNIGMSVKFQGLMASSEQLQKGAALVSYLSIGQVPTQDSLYWMFLLLLDLAPLWASRIPHYGDLRQTESLRICLCMMSTFLNFFLLSTQQNQSHFLEQLTGYFFNEDTKGKYHIRDLGHCVRQQ